MKLSPPLRPHLPHTPLLLEQSIIWIITSCLYWPIKLILSYNVWKTYPYTYRLDCDQHVSDTPIYKFDLLILNIITQYFVQIFCSPIVVTLQKMVIAHLVWAALIKGSQRHFTHLCVGCNVACMIKEPMFVLESIVKNKTKK